MKMSYTTLAIAALVATCCALPYVEESWHAEDDLLARVFDDSSPVTELIQSPSSIASASAKSADLAGQATAAATTEDAEKAKETADTAEAAKLLKAQQDLTKAAQAENIKQRAALVAAGQSAMQQSEAASKATKAANDASIKAQATYAAQEKAIAAAGTKATAEDKARLAATKKAVAKADAEVKVQEAKMASIAKAEAASKAALTKALAASDATYKSKMTTLQAAKKKANDGFHAEAKAIHAGFLKNMLKNKNDAGAAQKALKDEVVANNAQEVKDKKAIKVADDARKAALAKVNDAEAAVKKAAAKAEAGRRTDENGVKAGKAEATKVAFKKATEAANKLDEVAKKADAAEKASEARSKSDAKEEAVSDGVEDAEDNAMKECATDGSECQSCIKNGADKETCTCEKVSDTKGPYIGDNGFSCTATQTAADSNPNDDSGNSWAGISAPLPMTPLVAGDQAKCDSIAAAATGILKTAFAGKGCPLMSVACDKTPTTFNDRKAALNLAFAHAEACKPFCFPGTATTTDDGIADTNGICIGPDDVSGLKMQIDDLPVYKCMGTDCKIKAGPAPDLCRFITQEVCGLAGGAAISECAAVDTSVPFKARNEKEE